MTSLAAVQPESLPVRWTPISLGWSTSHGGPALRADEVVAVDRRRHRDALAARHHELEDRHLARHVLQRHAVHAQAEDRLAALPRLRLEVVAMRDEDLLAQRERPAELLAGADETVGHGGIERPDLRGHRGLPIREQASASPRWREAA